MQDEILTETLSLIDEETPLPGGWNFERLGDVADVVNGFGFSETLQGRKDLPFPFIKVSDMNAEGSSIVISKAANTVDETILKTLRARIYPAGTVIFPKVGGALLTNKKRILGTEASFDNNIMGIVPKTVEKDWIFYWILTVDLKTLANTQALPSIRQSDVANLKIPLPPTIEEQRRIASVLDEQMKAVEQARFAVEEQLKAANLLPNAFLRIVFESEEAQNWQKRKLGEVCENYTGTKDPRKSPEISFQYVDISSVDNINKRITESRKILGKDAPSRARQVIFADDVIVATTRPNLNAVALVPEKLNDEICSTGFCVLRPSDEINRDFLFAFVQSPYFIESLSDLVKGALYPAVTDKQVKQQTISLPPIEEQRKIAERINEQIQAAETLKKSLTEKLEAVKKLPAALLRKAFAGEI